MSLKFNPSLCSDGATDKPFTNILRKVFFRIRVMMLDAVSRKIENSKSGKVNVFKNTSIVEFDSIQKYVEPKVRTLKEIKSRHLRKYQRDRIKIIESTCRNRRFRKKPEKGIIKKEKNNWPEKKRQITKTAKANCPDQNAIDVRNKELSSVCISLLSKGPNFVPTP